MKSYQSNPNQKRILPQSKLSQNKAGPNQHVLNRNFSQESKQMAAAGYYSNPKQYSKKMSQQPEKHSSTTRIASRTDSSGVDGDGASNTLEYNQI